MRALLLQALYTIRSERMLMEQLDYNLLFWWFMGLNMDEAIWSPTTFSKNRDRLPEGEVARAFFQAVLGIARGWELVSDEQSTLVFHDCVNQPQTHPHRGDAYHRCTGITTLDRTTHCTATDVELGLGEE